MSEGFSNPIIGGGGGLVYPSIHSPNFALGPPITGWSIDKNGNVFLSGVLGGATWEMHSYGWFFYSGTPAAGNLVFSVASAGGTDQYGNAYKAGATSYVGGQISQLTGGLVNVSNQFNNTPGGLSATSGTAGLAELLSPTTGVADVQAILSAYSKNGIAGGPLFVVSTGIVATDPNSGGVETWHDLSGTVAAGWTPFAAPSNPRVKLLAEGKFAYVSGAGSHAGFSGGGNFINLPAAYTPAADRSISAYDNNGLPMGCVVRSTGVIEVFPTGTATQAVVGGMYPLD